MAASDVLELSLRRAARRAYERGRLQSALMWGTGAAVLASPGFLVCNRAPVAAACLAGFALAVLAGRLRGEDYERGTRSGALAGILPCLLPAAIGAMNPLVCMLMSSSGMWICGIGGVAAGVILGLRSRGVGGWRYWGSALVTLAFCGTIGCLPAGAIGFAGLLAGLIAGGAPVLATRRARA
jgi:hypothetical protein